MVLGLGVQEDGDLPYTGFWKQKSGQLPRENERKRCLTRWNFETYKTYVLSGHANSTRLLSARPKGEDTYTV